jgi:hypothetical protein
VPRGKPLTPDEIEQAAEVWHRTGNYSEAARAIGASDPSTVRQALLRHENTKRHQLHARACERGVREARKAIRYGLSKAVERFNQAADGQEFGNVMKALTDAARTLSALAEQSDRRRAAALARKKARAEIDALERRDTDEGGDVELVVEVTAGDAAVAAEPQAD